MEVEIVAWEFEIAAGGKHFGAPPAAIFRDFRARRYFQNAVGHTFSAKSRPVGGINVLHRAHLSYHLQFLCNPAGLDGVLHLQLGQDFLPVPADCILADAQSFGDAFAREPSVNEVQDLLLSC